MVKLYPVVHQNFALEENNEMVYCKKNHEIGKLAKIQTQCADCEYFYGCLQGEGVECEWEDVTDKPFWDVSNPQEELSRVSKLIDENLIQKG